VVLSVTKDLDRALGKVVLTATATALDEGYSVVGRKVVVDINGKTFRSVRTGRSGRAIVAIPERRLQPGKNPLTVRFYPGSPSYVSVISKATTIDLKRPDAVKLTIRRTVDKGTGETILVVRAKARFDGYRVSGRKVVLLVDSKAAKTAYTDKRGQAVFAFKGRDLKGARPGTNPMVVKFSPGSKRFHATVSQTYLLTLDRSWRITKTAVAK
jgi:hypothetical protein